MSASRPEPRASRPGDWWSRVPWQRPLRRSARLSSKPNTNAPGNPRRSRRRNPMLSSADYLAALPGVKFPVCGRLTRSVGLLLESTGPDLPVGALVKVRDRSADLICQVVGFQDERLQMLAIEETRQVAPGSLV